MGDKIKESIAVVAAVIILGAIVAVVVGAVFYVLNWLLAYSLNIPMLEYTQSCALALACVLVKVIFESLGY